MKALSICLLFLGLPALGAGGTIGSGAGGTIGSAAGGRTGSAATPSEGFLAFVDSRTGDRIDLSADPFAQFTAVIAQKMCDDKPCAIAADHAIELDGSAAELTPGRYIFKFGLSSSPLIEIRDRRPIAIPLVRFERPSQIASDRAILVFPFDDRSGDFSRARVFVADQMSAYLFEGRYSLGYQPTIVSPLSPHAWIHNVLVR